MVAPSRVNGAVGNADTVTVVLESFSRMMRA
jgi:hypothetical protein